MSIVSPVNPVPGVNFAVNTGGVAVVAVAGSPNGGFIQNPLLAADQGIPVAEPLYINPVTTAATVGNGTTFVIQPGGTWQLIPGQSSATSVNAPTSGHKFSVVSF
jgi:hypothetical protein